MPSTPLDRILDFYRRSDTPFTLGLLTATVATFVLSFSLGAYYFLAANFFFPAPQGLLQPWRMVTYPLVVGRFDILALLFSGLALWWFGGSLERSWSTRGYAAFWFCVAVVTALSMSLGVLVLGLGTAVVTSYLPLGAIVLAWAVLNPEAVIMLYGIVPLKAKYLAVGEVLIIFFTHAGPHPLLGFFALGGCAFAFWWARSFAPGTFGGYPAPPRFDSFFNTGSASTSGGSNRPRRPRKVLTPLDDRRTWKDWGPLAAWQRYKRRKQFERLLRDDDDDE